MLDWAGVAPRHVMYDDHYGQEFVFRQPQTPEYLRGYLFKLAKGREPAPGDRLPHL